MHTYEVYNSRTARTATLDVYSYYVQLTTPTPTRPQAQTHTPYNPPDNPSLYSINVQDLHLEHSHSESVLL